MKSTAKRMTTAQHFIEAAHATHQLCVQSRFQFAIDGAYIAALEVAVQAGFELKPQDEDMHPLESAARVALTVLPVSAQDKQLWPRYLHYLRNCFVDPLQANPAPLHEVVAWSERAVAAADQWLAGRGDR